MSPAAPGAEVAYLVNLYPAASHSFIRREIAALEGMGWRVHRFAHRRHDGALPDEADRRELELTTVLSATGVRGMVRAVGSALWHHPCGAAAALCLSVRLSWGSDRPLLKHLGHWLLACVFARQLRTLSDGMHVHAHFGTNPAAVALLLHRMQGRSYSLTIHGPHEFEHPERLHLARKIAQAKFIATVSKAGCEDLRSRHPEAASRVLHVPCGLNSEWFAEPVTPVPPTKQLVCVARLDPQKDPLRLVAAAALLVQRGWHFKLMLVGDGSLRPDMARAIRSAGLEATVILLGMGSQGDVQRELRAARALVLSSVGEGLPVAIMEAFACGRPVIATDVGGVGELVENRATGWLVPASDTEALAAAMAEALAADSETLQALADAGRRRVARHDVRASASILAKAWRSVYSPSGRI